MTPYYYDSNTIFFIRVLIKRVILGFTSSLICYVYIIIYDTH